MVVSLDTVDFADECLDLTDSAGILALPFVPGPASCWDTSLKFLDLLDAPVYCDTDAFDTCAVAVSGALGLYACFDGLDGLDLVPFSDQKSGVFWFWSEIWVQNLVLVQIFTLF